MLNKIFILIFFILLLKISVYSQDNKTGISSGPAPYVKVQYPSNLLKDAPNYIYSRAFAYNAYGGTIPLGPCKFWLTGTGLTSLYTDPLSSNFVQAGCFCGTDGFWYGVRYGTNALVKIDTSTGIITQIAIVTGASSITGIAWNYTNSTMYALNYVSGASNVGTLNLTTGVYTPLSGTLSTGMPIDMACSNSGQLYVHVVTSLTTQSQIYKYNSGGFTALPSTTGFIANYAQGMSWDHYVDSGYLAAYNYSTSAGELRKINIATGTTTLIATITSEADGMAIPGCTGLTFGFTPYPNTTNTTGPYIINVTILPCGSGINPFFTKILWSRNNTLITDSSQMTNSGGYNWTGNIPGNGTYATYRYYIRTVDSLGRFVTIPAGAPAILYSFIVSTDTSKPVITHTPLGDCFKREWPCSVICQVTDNFGVDSVWVRWNKNHGISSRFNLTHVSGNIWSNPFNSDSSQVINGDSIFYRIIARDISELKDSLSIYGFRIITLPAACIGSGTLSSNYPFSTYWEDGRTDMLFTASELINAGVYPTGIYGISFNVISVGGPSMNGFNIKMQHTSATSITEFINSGWQTCYNGIYTVTTTGRQIINLTFPFYWNGSSNLLIEVCYNNSSWTAYSPVYATSATNMMVGYSTDLPTGDGCTATWTATVLPYRANICFVQIIDELHNNSSVIPNSYSLFQNYPNPFNPVTQINYDIPKKGFVILKVFDILGREVAKLVNEEKQPGSYIVDFDGSNFASGVYFYKLEVNEFTDVKRMVIIK